MFSPTAVLRLRSWSFLELVLLFLEGVDISFVSNPEIYFGTSSELLFFPGGLIESSSSNDGWKFISIPKSPSSSGFLSLSDGHVEMYFGCLEDTGSPPELTLGTFPEPAGSGSGLSCIGGRFGYEGCFTMMPPAMPALIPAFFLCWSKILCFSSMSHCIYSIYNSYLSMSFSIRSLWSS